MATRRLDNNRDMTFGNGVADYLVGIDEVKQNVLTRLYFLAGEWMLNTELGLPYFTDFAEKPLSLPYIETLVKKTIVETPGVTGVSNLTINFDANTRKIFITANVSTEFDLFVLETQV